MIKQDSNIANKCNISTLYKKDLQFIRSSQQATGDIKKVTGQGGVHASPFESRKITTRRPIPEIDIPQDELPRNRNSHTNMQAQGNYYVPGAHLGHEALATPRTSRIRMFSKNTLQGSSIADLEQSISRITNDMRSVNASGRDKQQPLNLRLILKVQANFRRRQVQRKAFKKMLKMSRYRRSVFNELVKTEDLYVQDLKILMSKFIAEIKHKSLMSDSEIQRCFANFSSIIELNSNMLVALKHIQWHPNKKIITNILDYAYYFRIYFEYCNNYQNMLSILDKKQKESAMFASFYKEAQRQPEFRKMEIVSFLVKPVQRVPKYVLLLKDYLKHTEHDHPEYKTIEKVLEIFSKVSDENNKHMDRILMNAKMFELQRIFQTQCKIKIIDPKRDFKSEEPLTIFWRNHPKSVIAYFLSDLILVAERDNQQHEQMKLLATIQLSDNSFVKDLPEHNSFKFLISVIGEQETITFILDSQDMKNKIYFLVNSLIGEIISKNQKRNEALEKMQKFSIVPNSMHQSKKRKWRIDVQVVGTEERQSTVSTYIVYIVEVSIEEIVSKIFIRHREFEEFQNMVYRNFPSLSIRYYQAQKQLFSDHNDQKKIEYRKLAIQNFLQDLLGNPEFYENTTKNQPILKYIGLPQNFYELPQILQNFEKECDDGPNQNATGSPTQSFVAHSPQSLIQSVEQSKLMQSQAPNDRPSIRRPSIKGIKQAKFIDMPNRNTLMGEKPENQQDLSQKVYTELTDDQKWQNKTFIDLPKPESLMTETPREPRSKIDNRASRSQQKDPNKLRKVSASKLLQSTSASKQSNVKHTIQIKLPNQVLEMVISEDTRALDVIALVAQRIGLQSTYDYKLVDDRYSRYLLDDEIVQSVFQHREREGVLNNALGIFSKMKSIVGDKWSLTFKKVLFLSKPIEISEMTLDPVRLDLMVAQVLSEITSLNKINLQFKEYCTVAAIMLYVEKKQITMENISKYIPQTLQKATKKEMWVTQVQEQHSKLNIDPMIAKRVLLNVVQSNKLYGMAMFQVENTPENKFKKEVPKLCILGINYDGIHVIEPMRKQILKTFYQDQILEVKANPGTIEIVDENATFKFNTSQGFQISQLYDEYYWIQVEAQAAQDIDKD